MDLRQYGDGQAFWHDVATPLCGEPVRNNVFIGVANRVRKEIRRDIFRAGLFDGTELVLGALRLPPHRLSLAHAGQGETAIATLVRHLVEGGISVPGVFGEQRLAELFALRWTSETGQDVHVPRPGAAQNLYEISRVTPPHNVAGAMRPAQSCERDLILKWELAFANDAGLPEAERDADYVARFVDEGIGDGTFRIWEAAGEPVATARFRPISDLGARISGVYTPDARRGLGYASALTAALSEKVLAAGLYCCLFADADNALTNRIYQRIGYVKLATYADMLFAGAGKRN